LRGNARKWLKLYLDDFLNNKKKNNRKPRTNKLFGNITTFLKDLRKLYSGIDEFKKAKR